eukprot:jgi/Botrbrau1/15103/Bobra.0240s0004.1
MTQNRLPRDVLRIVEARDLPVPGLRRAVSRHKRTATGYVAYTPCGQQGDV